MASGFQSMERDQTNAVPTKCSLLELPAELQSMVLRHVYQDSVVWMVPTTRARGTSGANLCLKAKLELLDRIQAHEGMRTIRTCSTAILLACRALHGLGTLAFWTESTFQFADIHDLDMCVAEMVPVKRGMIKRVEIKYLSCPGHQVVAKVLGPLPRCVFPLSDSSRDDFSSLGLLVSLEHVALHLYAPLDDRRIGEIIGAFPTDLQHLKSWKLGLHASHDGPKMFAPIEINFSDLLTMDGRTRVKELSRRLLEKYP